MKRFGLFILVTSWLPLLAVALTDPGSNPIGLGLLGWREAWSAWC